MRGASDCGGVGGVYMGKHVLGQILGVSCVLMSFECLLGGH
jgi:hypothetical protein